MKKLLSGLAVASLLAGCASVLPNGILYTGGNFNNGSVTVDANAAKYNNVSRVGKSCATSVFGLVAWGDNSVAAAKDNGSVAKVNAINYEVDNVLGVFGKYCTVVKGE